MTREEAISLLHDMKDTYDEIHENTNYEIGYEQMTALDMAIEALQEVQKHKETFEWCTDCKEYDKDNYCCHRWSKTIRNTLEELVVRCKDCRWFKQDSSPVGYGYCDGRMVGREVDYNDFCSYGERRE